MLTLPVEMRSKLKSLILSEESYKQFPYTDTTGHLTVGIGRNLAQVGLSLDEALYLLDNDIMACERNLAHYAPWYDGLDNVRKVAILSITFNLGIHGILKFEDMIAAVVRKDYGGAAVAMLNSRWAKQVKSRAIYLASVMEHGIL